MKAVALAFAIATTGCWATTVHSGKPAGAIPPGWLDRWHSGVLFGAVELSGPYDLNAICPHGWSEVRTQMSALNAVLTVLTFDIYSTQRVTVVCAR